ncbi:MAG: acyl-CoA dehydrogenase family protein, partial [Candidatus Methylomirabilis sp.]|nr:acyl-CoA dehydrogenase family protein [Deltaproteobacteria bacterium]
MERTLYTEEHKQFRDAFVKFLEAEVVPFHPQWEKDGIVPRAIWEKAGGQGYLCPWLPEKYGGSDADFYYSAIVSEECARLMNHGFTMGLHSDIVVPYLYHYGNEEQRERWLPGCASGKIISAVAMTEPGTGSDLAAIRTTAIRDGDHYIVNGQKTFISNGILSDVVIVAAKTDPKANPPHAGVSLIVVERGTPGFERGRNLEKMGMHAQDTAEMSFSDCRVPVANLLGEEGQGFLYLMRQLQQERIVCAIAAQAGAAQAVRWTVDYVNQRHAFGKPLGKLQNTRFKLAECQTQVDIGQVFVDRLIQAHANGEFVVKEASEAK